LITQYLVVNQLEADKSSEAADERKPFVRAKMYSYFYAAYLQIT